MAKTVPTLPLAFSGVNFQTGDGGQRPSNGTLQYIVRDGDLRHTAEHMALLGKLATHVLVISEANGVLSAALIEAPQEEEHDEQHTHEG